MNNDSLCYLAAAAVSIAWLLSPANAAAFIGPGGPGTAGDADLIGC